MRVYGDRIRIAEFRGPQPTPDFLDRSRPAPRRRSLPKLHGAGVAAVGFRFGACDAALAPRPLRKIVADNFFPIIGIRAMLNRGRVRRRIAGPLVAAETTQNWRKRDSGVTPKAPLRSKALDEVGGVCGEGLQDIVSLLAGS